MSGANGTTPLRKRLAEGEKVAVTKLAKGGLCASAMPGGVGKMPPMAPTGPMSPITKVKRANGVAGLKKGGTAKGGKK